MPPKQEAAAVGYLISMSDLSAKRGYEIKKIGCPSRRSLVLQLSPIHGNGAGRQYQTHPMDKRGAVCGREKNKVARFFYFYTPL